MMPDHRNFASYYGNTLYPVYRLGHIRHHTHAGNYKDTPSNRVLQRRTAMDTFFHSCSSSCRLRGISDNRNFSGK